MKREKLIAAIHALVDGKDVGGEEVGAMMRILTDLGLLIADPNDNIEGD